jgi:hypothetical protein
LSEIDIVLRILIGVRSARQERPSFRVRDPDGATAAVGANRPLSGHWRKNLIPPSTVE